jgi:Rod binding domain-containing protein
MPNISAIAAQPASPAVERALEVREAFNSFVGETFFQQMLKAMRSTTGKPAYFHGGRAEEIFRGQLDQQMATEMTEASADRLAEPLFANQFPRQAEILRQHELNSQSSFAELEHLPRR